jgi:uncharacterized protein
MSMNEDSAASRAAICLVCGKPRTPAYRPFCSARCRDIDLGRWLRGTYRVETDEGLDDQADDNR